MAPKLELANRILTQKRRDHCKVYSMHVPEVVLVLPDMQVVRALRAILHLY